MANTILGVIGGTGLGDALTRDHRGESMDIATPYGKTSSPVTLIQWDGHQVAFISRHGRGHRLGPSWVPYRANIFAMKKLGVTQILASGATGSLREDIHPRELVIVDQVIDKTYKRENSFFGRDIAVHVEFAQPFCPRLRAALLEVGADLELPVHDGGTYVCMEGPQFSTVAESNWHRAAGGDLIGMTCLPEARLAREAEICYALVAMPTDYDCWRPHEPQADRLALLEVILENLETATANAARLIRYAVQALAGHHNGDCSCRQALERGIWSDPRQLDKNSLAPLRLLLEKYVPFDDC